MISLSIHAAELYPGTTRNIIHSSQNKLKISDHARKKYKELARKATVAELKKELKQLIRTKKLDQAKSLKSLIKTMEDANNNNISSGSNQSDNAKNVLNKMHKQYQQADEHFKKNKEKIQTALIVSIEKEMMLLDKRGKIEDALKTQSLLKKIKEPGFELLEFDFNPKEKIAEKEKPLPPPEKKEPEKEVIAAKIEKPKVEIELAEIRSKIDKNDLSLMINLKIKAHYLKKKYPDNPEVKNLIAQIDNLTAPSKKELIQCPECSGKGISKQACKSCKDLDEMVCNKCIGSGLIVSREICPDCKGKGKNWFGLKCKKCNGDEKIKMKIPCKNCQKTGKIKCPECKGSKVISGKCQKCNGKGKIKN